VDAPGKIAGNEFQVDAIHGIGSVLGFVDFIESKASHLETAADDTARFYEPVCITNNKGPAPRVRLNVCKALHNDLGADAGGISHGDGNDWTSH
jgi:hypothetical protein